MTEQVDPAPVKVAFIIDGEVVDVINTDDRWGAIFLSEPTTVDVTDMVKAGIPLIGRIYDENTKQFVPLPEVN
jgi:hypothetical protein